MTAVDESQTIARLTRIKDHLLLSRISWETYEALLVECEDRRLRHSYDRGSLEFMTFMRTCSSPARQTGPTWGEA